MNDREWKALDIEALQDLILRPGWKVLKNKFKQQFDEKYKLLRNCNPNDNKYERINGWLDILEHSLEEIEQEVQPDPDEKQKE